MLKSITTELNILQIKLDNKDAVGVKDSIDKIASQTKSITVDNNNISSEKESQEVKDAQKTLDSAKNTITKLVLTANSLESSFETIERYKTELEETTDLEDKKEIQASITKIEKEVMQLWDDMSKDFVILESIMSKLQTVNNRLVPIKKSEQTAKVSALAGMNLI